MNKKMIDAEGVSNFYSTKVSTAGNKICEIKKPNTSYKEIILE